MRQLIPHFILENYTLGRTSGAFPAAGLFVDTSGFSKMTSALMVHGQHGAEVLASVMRDTLDPLMRSVFEQGGFVISQEGDSFSALFPYDPLSPDHCALHALAAACQIQRRAAEHSQHTTPYGKFTVTVKAGLSFGQASWGIISSNDGQRAAYYFQGTAVDGCVEAEEASLPGKIIMDADFYTCVQAHTAVDPVGAFYCLSDYPDELPRAAPVTPPDVDLSLAGRFLPPSLFTQRHSGEFRQVASLFINLPTVRNEVQLRIFMQTAFELLDSYGGVLRLYFGDKGAHITIYWGGILSHENDLERALSFALELQTQTAIPVKAGLTYQIAHTGFIGGDLAEDYCAYGLGTNLAARLMSTAPRGEIWVDENVVALAERRRGGKRFNFEFAGEQTFKGFSQPQKVFLLLDRQEDDETFFAGPLVGRDAEIDRLHIFTQPIFSGQYAGMLIIWGEPGLGKSRLVHEFLNTLEQSSADGFQFFLGQTDEILRQPLNPFRYWLHRYFQVSDSQVETRNKRSFNRKLDELISITQHPGLADELDRTRSFLGALVGLYWPDSLYEQLDAKGRYENTFLALAALLKAESLRCPVILVLEDIHWLDDDSKELISYLLRAMSIQEESAFPFTILATARYEDSGLPLDRFQYQELNLMQLDRHNLEMMASSLLNAPASPRLLDLLADRSQGNPFFAEQVLRYLIEESLLKQDQGAWDVLSNQSMTLPTDVGTLLVARLDRLSQEVKEAVQTASVLGREFDLYLLTDMLLSGEYSTHHLVHTAEEQGIWTTLNEISYIFKHVLMRDAAYQMQLQSQRQTLHALAVNAYEKRFAGHLQDQYGALAYHAEQAGLSEKARRYLKLAGYAALDAFQNSLAGSYFTRALALSPENDLEARYELLMARETVYGYQGNTTERQRDLDALEALLPALNDISKSVELALRQSSYALDTGASSAVETFALRAKALAQTAGLKEKVATASWVLANALRRQGKHDQAASEAGRGLSLAREVGSRKEEIRGLNILGLVAVEQGRMEDAHSYFSQSMAIAREIGNLHLMAAPLNNLGLVAGMQGNQAAAWKYYEESLEITRQTGERSGESIVLGNLGYIAKSLGEFQKAKDYLEQNLRIAREAGIPYVEVYSLINLSACLGAMRDYETAAGYARQSRELSQKIGERSGEAWALTYLGHSQFAMGNLAAAGAAYAEALDIRQELKQPALAAEPAAGLARTELQRGNIPTALQHLNHILTYLEAGGTLDSTDEPLRVYLSCFLTLSRAGDSRAARFLETAYRSLQAQAEKITDATARQSFLNEVDINREIQSAMA